MREVERTSHAAPPSSALSPDDGTPPRHRGNTAVVYYVLDTADRSGAYADVSHLVEQP